MELKRCPWCGESKKEKIIRPWMDGRFYIDHIDAVFHLKSSIGFATEKEAAEAWNAQDGQTDAPLDIWEKMYRERRE